MAPQVQTAPHHLDQDARNGIRFAGEMAGAVALLAGAAWLRHVPVGDPVLQTMLRLLPIVPVWLMFAVGLRHYFRIDEFQRLQFLKAMALTMGITLCLSWSYPFARAVLPLPAQTADQSLPFSIVFIAVTLALNLRAIGHQVRKTP